jgi:hypothetical protein
MDAVHVLVGFEPPESLMARQLYNWSMSSQSLPSTESHTPRGRATGSCEAEEQCERGEKKVDFGISHSWPTWAGAIGAG